jgi:hypothetical protein
MPGTVIVQRLVLLAATCLVTVGCASAHSTQAIDEAMSHDGLQKIRVDGLELAYARPGASLVEYTKVKLEPVEVAFDKNWDPQVPGSHFKISSRERENIRAGVATIVNEQFVKELQRDQGYQIVQEPGPDVLRVKTSIINLSVTAPDNMTPGMTRVYTVSSGEMTLFAELYDSETGALLARAIDRREARDSGRLTLSDSVVNLSANESIASTWARILRKALDKAHRIGAKA